MILQALALTLRLAVVVALILIVIALPLGYWLAMSRSRLKFLVESVVALPIVLPPTVLGFYVLTAIGPLSAIGRWYHVLTGGSLAFTFHGLVIGSVLYSLPFAVQPIAAAFSSVDRTLLEASATLGASSWRSFWKIILPLGIPGVFTGLVLSFAHTLGEFGVVLMIGGNLAGITRTISISIFDKVQALDYAAANQTAFLLLLFSFLVLAITYGLQRKGIAVWRPR